LTFEDFGVRSKKMYLSRLKVSNFRSIKSIDVKFHPGKNIIVGRNNSGKSNIIKALDIVLGENSPTYQKSENITELDFYSKKTIKEDKEIVQCENEISILCKLERSVDEPLNYEEIYKCYGFYRYIKPITNGDLENNLSTLFKINVDDLDRSEKTYVNPKLKNQQPFEKEFDDKYEFAYGFMAHRSEENQISKEIRFFYRQDVNSPWFMSFSASIRNELLLSAIIPSFRDPQNQLRPVVWTWFGKLMRYLTISHGKDSQLKTAFEGVKQVADQIFEEARTKIQETSLNVAFPGAKIHFQFNEDFKTDIYKDSKIYIDDGVKTPLSEKGSGIQSATIIGLFNFYTQKVNTKTSALLCIEEPELYLHPHARRVISDRLDEFLNNGKNQVIISTHSSEFIRTTDETLNIILVRKENNETDASPIGIKQSRYLLLDNNYNEIFFADKAIVCEGLDAYILRWVVNEKYPGRLDEQNISLVTAAGKDNIDKLTKMITHLKIKCFVLADFDYLLRDKAETTDKYKKPKHESIMSLEEAFFKQECIFGSSADGEVNKIKKVRQEIKTDEEESFYKAKKITDLNKNGAKYINFLEGLRKKGICILDSEIENIFKDSSIISSGKKLSLNEVFEINKYLSNKDAKISDIINTSQFEKFIDHVLES
jgi:putative ATP-dependent endonuclease of the OLD family